MYDFLIDLDEFFCEKYANYDKLCILPGYKMPMMQASEVREDGRTYAYTLPAETMRLGLQEKKAELLTELKNRMVDTTFSFSFRIHGFWARKKAWFSKLFSLMWALFKIIFYTFLSNNINKELIIYYFYWKIIIKIYIIVL